MRWPVTLILLTVGHLTMADEPVFTTVDEVVAVVDRTPILASDLDLAGLLGLVERAPASTASEHRSALLDARIQLEVQFRDLEASGVLYRLDLDVPAVRRSLVDAAGGEPAVAEAMAAGGLDGADIDELALRVSAANAFADQRLRPRVSVSLQEIEAAYASLASELEVVGESPPPLTAVHDRLHQLITERKLNDEIERWVERARAEHEITRFVP
jgi:hypothetical protein